MILMPLHALVTLISEKKNGFQKLLVLSLTLYISSRDTSISKDTHVHLVIIGFLKFYGHIIKFFKNVVILLV